MYQKKFPYLLNLRIKVKTHNHKCIFVKTNLHICSSFSINHSLIVCLYTSEAHPSTDKRNQQSTNNVKQNLTYFYSYFSNIYPFCKHDRKIQPILSVWVFRQLHIFCSSGSLRFTCQRESAFHNINEIYKGLGVEGVLIFTDKHSSTKVWSESRSQVVRY